MSSSTLPYLLMTEQKSIMYEDYYTEPEEYRISKHSGFGIASFLIVLAAGALEFVLVAIAGILETIRPGGMDEDSPIAILLGLAMFGGLLVNLLGILLGVVGLLQRDRKKPFAVLGVIIGFLVFVGLVAVIVIGILAD
jgi:hypothetical protein